jgi:hypothetical protein
MAADATVRWSLSSTRWVGRLVQWLCHYYKEIPGCQNAHHLEMRWMHSRVQHSTMAVAAVEKALALAEQRPLVLRAMKSEQSWVVVVMA